MKVVLTIAGSDSGGGAGIQADLKTFSILGVHGTCAVTAVTAQNTLGVREVFPLAQDAVTAQIDTVAEDMHIDFAKSGMLFSPDIVRIVANKIKQYDIPLVLDPVLHAEAGGALLSDDAVPALVDELVPLARVITPNIAEAERLTGIRIRSGDDAKKAALALCDMGARSAIIKGGHLDAVDVVYDGSFTFIGGERTSGETHGSGCTHSAALAAWLAKGASLPDAARMAHEFVVTAIRAGMKVGRGVGPVNQSAGMLRDAWRYAAQRDVALAVSMLERDDNFHALVPEVGCNIGTAIPDATSPDDVAAVEGRIVRLGSRVHAVGCVSFGASRHVARVILAAVHHNPAITSAMNIRYSANIIDACKNSGLTVAQFSREDEPPGKSTMEWGTDEAIRASCRVPDVIFDAGAVGKEPMVRLLGRSAVEVAGRAIGLGKLV